MKKVFSVLALILAVFLLFSGCAPKDSDIVNDVNNNVIDSKDNDVSDNDIENSASDTEDAGLPEDEQEIDEDGVYTDPLLVAKYIHTYNKLPSNFITKKEAAKLGWESDKGNLWEVTDKMSIGGDKFGNREGLLPKKEGRVYYECDVNYEGGFRGAERIVFFGDGLIFYTDDHYESFSQLY